MLIILSIYSKNLSSLTNFLKFFYKLKTNKTFKLKVNTRQSQQKKKFSFFSVLKSPHVNKKSQEQFEYYMYRKKLKIYIYNLAKFLTIWKLIKSKLFFDVKIETKFLLHNKRFKSVLFDRIDSDKFILKFNRNKNYHSSNLTNQTFFKLLDIRGEILLNSLLKSLDSSVGRAKD